MGDSDEISSLFCFEGFRLDAARRTLHRGSMQVDLRPKCFDVLVCLARAAGRVVTKDELSQAVWPNVVVTDESLTRCVSDLRQALGDTDQRIVKTAPRRGYVLAAPVTLVVAGPDGHPAAVPGTEAQGSASTSAASQVAAPEPSGVRARLGSWPSPALAVLAALVVAGVVWLSGSRTGGLQAHAPPPLSIVVLPLQVRGADRAQEDLAAVLTDEITSDLSRIRESFVIGRGSAESYRGRVVDAREVGRELGVRYVLEGSLARLGDTVRLALRLVDAQTARVLWAESIDGRIDDLTTLHAAVTGRVARSLETGLVQAEADRLARRRPVDIGAQDLVVQAWAAMTRPRTPEAVAAARAQLERALALDPESASAWTWLATTYMDDVGGRYVHLRGASREEWLEQAARAAERAYALAPADVRVLTQRGRVLSHLGRSQEALAPLQRALERDRNHVDAWRWLCYANVTLARNREGIAACEEAIRLSPRDRSLAGFMVVGAAGHLYDGNDREALAWARRSIDADPSFSVPHSWAAAAAANLEDMAAARAALAEFRRLLPHYTVTSFRNEKLCSNELCERQRERYYDGLRKAGLPE
ncbi:MAG: winged helix-turn-helix domain-containing protein [Pseudomonadota bacterium]